MPYITSFICVCEELYSTLHHRVSEVPYSGNMEGAMKHRVVLSHQQSNFLFISNFKCPQRNLCNTLQLLNCVVSIQLGDQETHPPSVHIQPATEPYRLFVPCVDVEIFVARRGPARMYEEEQPAKIYYCQAEIQGSGFKLNLLQPCVHSVTQCDGVHARVVTYVQLTIGGTPTAASRVSSLPPGQLIK